MAAVSLEERTPGATERGVPGLRAPMVGRDRELELLRSLYQRSAEEGRPNLVTIYGDPGVGKSRLVAEFVGWADGLDPPPTVVRGRCLPYGDGVTYWPLAEILKGLADIRDSDATEVALERIQRLGHDLITTDVAAHPEKATAALAYSVGLEDPALSFASMEPREVSHKIHAAWRSLFSSLASRAPVVAVIDDIHWADQILLDLLEELADRVVGPAIFLCPARPELTERRPGWGGGKRNVSSVGLDPLTAVESDRLVGLLLSVADLPPSVHERILERAEGNPFFLEEIVRHLIDEGVIVREGRRWRADVDDRRGPDPGHGAGRARGQDRPAGPRREARAPARGGRRPGVLARAGRTPAERRPRPAAVHARSSGGARAGPVAALLLDRRGAGVHLQAHPHARGRLREPPPTRAGGRARGRRVVDRGDRGQTREGVRRAARLPLHRGVPRSPR